MAGTFKARTLVETDQYAAELASLGNIRRLDEALRGLMWSLATKPEEWEQIPGMRLRLAKTDAFANAPPGLRIWFVIEDDKVHLLSIEAEEPLPD